MDGRSEETLKVDIYESFFGEYAYETLGKIDFAIAYREKTQDERQYLLWAEAKKGAGSDLNKSLVQLILTIGKARAMDEYMPPHLLGAFDAEKIAFVEYSDVQDVFYQNDFNWNVAPSDYETREFRMLEGMVGERLADKKYVFYYERDEKELREFVKWNFSAEREGANKIKIRKSNFINIFYRWCDAVRPMIDVDWEEYNRNGIISADFFLADLMSRENVTFAGKLNVLLHTDRYRMKEGISLRTNKMQFSEIEFKDGCRAHSQFWFKYERPPMPEYQDYILDRRDMMVPANVREVKGSFYTPRQWVEKSQEYLANTLGDDWQDEYYVWDCCAGTGNLLRGLTGYARVFASTLDQQDVDVMQETISDKILPSAHIFQFDFLNDDLQGAKVPEDLRKILGDAKKRKRLIIYINPPYAEAGNVRTLVGTGKHKTNVAVKMKAYTNYVSEIGLAGRELFAQFFVRIYREINGCILAEFSKLKHLQAANFEKFRNVFQPKLRSLFLVPASSFDNVSGHFPIGFFIWDTKVAEPFKGILADVYGDEKVETKYISSVAAKRRINNWLLKYRDKGSDYIGFLAYGRNDFQHQNYIYILNDRKQMPVPRGVEITRKNLKCVMVYVAVSHCIRATWLNDRDQFLYPNDGWEGDLEFQSDCLVYTLFHGQNRVSCAEGVNHWIPFEEKEVGAQGLYDSHFMIDYMKGRVVREEEELFEEDERTRRKDGQAIEISAEGKAVMDAGRELWRYYHRQKGAKADASYYDIRLHFQGKSNSGNMNPMSGEEEYNRLHDVLKEAMVALGKKVERGVWKWGFLE